MPRNFAYCSLNPTRIRFLPPPAATTLEHIDLAIELLEQSLMQFVKKLSDGDQEKG